MHSDFGSAGRANLTCPKRFPFHCSAYHNFPAKGTFAVLSLHYADYVKLGQARRVRPGSHLSHLAKCSSTIPTSEKRKSWTCHSRPSGTLQPMHSTRDKKPRTTQSPYLFPMVRSSLAATFLVNGYTRLVTSNTMQVDLWLYPMPNSYSVYY